jgi:hypothetical protein
LIKALRLCDKWLESDGSQVIAKRIPVMLDAAARSDINKREWLFLQNARAHNVCGEW